jgi:predicted RND superfamily exporter protein
VEGTSTDRLVLRLVGAVTRYRWLVLVGALGLVVAAGAGLPRLSFVADYTYHLDPKSPGLRAFESLENTYTKNDNLLFVLAPERGDVFERDPLEAILWLTERAWQIPHAIRVDSLSNYPDARAHGDELRVDNLFAEDALEAGAAIAELRRRAAANPQIVGRLLSRDARASAVHVTLQLPEQGGGESEATVFARDLAQTLEERHPGLRVAVTGIAPLAHAMDRAARSDLELLVPLMLGVLCLALAVGLRSAWGTLGILLIAGGSSVVALGLAGWVGIPLTPPSANAPTLILTIAVADGVHLLVAYAGLRRGGQAREPALAESVRTNWRPLYLTTLTTLIGFLALRASDVAPYADLGTITAFGVVAAWCLSVGFLPAFLAVGPDRVPARPPRFTIGMERLAGWVTRRHRALLWASAPLVIVSAICVQRIALDDLFLTWFDTSTPFRRDTDLAVSRMAGVYTLHYALPAGAPGAVADPDYLAQLDEFSAWLRAQPDVDHVYSLSDTVKRLHRSLQGDEPDSYRIPKSRELVAQILLLYEMSLPYGLDLNHQIDVDRSASQVIVTLNVARATELRAVEERVSVGTFVAFGLIALILVAMFRSVRLGLLSLVPNLVPIVLAFGIWGVTVGEAGIAVAVVSAASLGLIVDATVHLLARYEFARREHGATARDAVRYALCTAGSALWVSSLVLLAGFSVLALSDFQANAQFGLLVALTIVGALAADFLLLPALLLVWAPRAAAVPRAAESPLALDGTSART